MRALAEFIMRGRAQAAAVALLVTLLSPPTVALVTLRRGGWSGAFVIAWAMLPALVMTVVNPQTVATAFGLLAVLVATLGGAMVLRSQARWPVALFGLLAVSATGGAVFVSSFPELTSELIAETSRMQEELSAEVRRQGGEPGEPLEVTGAMISGVVAFGVAFFAMLSLVIGRWWQAILYNPGGFRVEFHELRLSKTQALTCFGIAALCTSDPTWLYWGGLAALPLLMVSAAIVHNRVRAQGWGPAWVVMFYVAIILLFPLSMVVLFLIGFTDSWLDYRRRFGPRDQQAHKH